MHHKTLGPAHGVVAHMFAIHWEAYRLYSSWHALKQNKQPATYRAIQVHHTLLDPSRGVKKDAHRAYLVPRLEDTPKLALRSQRVDDALCENKHAHEVNRLITRKTKRISRLHS